MQDGLNQVVSSILLHINFNELGKFLFLAMYSS